MQKANVNCNVLKNYFDFLIKQGAVEEKSVSRDRIVYAITDRGSYLIRCFKELNQVIPTVKISEIPSTKLKNQFGQPEYRNLVNTQTPQSLCEQKVRGLQRNLQLLKQLLAW
jgi:DNA-binding PadR family transcriptional regulator